MYVCFVLCGFVCPVALLVFSEKNRWGRRAELSAQEQGVPDHFRGGWRGPVRAETSPTLQHRQRETWPHCMPRWKTICVSKLARHEWNAPDRRLPSRPGFGQMAEKSAESSDHPTPHFGAQDHQSGAANAPMKLWVRGLFAPRGILGCTVDVDASGCGVPSNAAQRSVQRIGHVEEGPTRLPFSAARSMSWTLTWTVTWRLLPHKPALRRMAATHARFGHMRFKFHPTKFWVQHPEVSASKL